MNTTKRYVYLKNGIHVVQGWIQEFLDGEEGGCESGYLLTTKTQLP